MENTQATDSARAIPSLNLEHENQSALTSRNLIRGHIPALDGLRGIAILMVLIIHFYQKPLFVNTGWTCKMLLGRTIGAGHWGVELFFVLSGFLITGILLDTKHQERALYKFYMRRCLRIFPLYYLTLVILLTVLPRFVTLDAGAREVESHQAYLWTYMANWPGVPWLWEDSHQYFVGHFWSLCVEEQFYVLWPSFVFLLASRGLVKACVGAMVLGFASRLICYLMNGHLPLILKWSTLHKIDGLAMGAMIAVLLRDPRITAVFPKGRSLNLALAVFGTLFVLGEFMPRAVDPELVLVFTETVAVIFFGVVLVWTLQSGAESFLTSRFLAILGKYSYGIYVIHGILRPEFERLFNFENLPSRHGLCFVYQGIYYILTISLSFGLAFISYNLFEKRFLDLKRYFNYTKSYA